jgi:hypothetical protein
MKIDWHAVQHRAMTTGFCFIWMLSILYALSAFAAGMAEFGTDGGTRLVKCSAVAVAIAAIAMCAHAAEIRYNMKRKEERGERRDR